MHPASASSALKFLTYLVAASALAPALRDINGSPVGNELPIVRDSSGTPVTDGSGNAVLSGDMEEKEKKKQPERVVDRYLMVPSASAGASRRGASIVEVPAPGSPAVDPGSE